MNRRDLVLAVSAQTGMERRQVDTVLRGFTDVVTAVVAKGEPVAVSGFAKFVKVNRPARMGRNPQTQEPVRIKASKKARITPLKGFKDAVLTPSLAPKLERGVYPPAPAKAGSKKSAAKKSTAKKRSTAKKATARKTTARKGGAKKATARKATTRKTAAKKSTARKATAKKTAAKRSTAKKTTARKTTARKSTAKRSTARKSTARKTSRR